MKRTTEAEAREGLVAYFLKRLQTLTEHRRRPFTDPDYLRELVEKDWAKAQAIAKRQLSELAEARTKAQKILDNAEAHPKEAVQNAEKVMTRAATFERSLSDKSCFHPDRQYPRLVQRFSGETWPPGCKCDKGEFQPRLVPPWKTYLDSNGCDAGPVDACQRAREEGTAWHVFEAIELANTHARNIAEAMADEVVACVTLLFPAKQRTAALSREHIPAAWMWPRSNFATKHGGETTKHAACAALALSFDMLLFLDDPEDKTTLWHGEVARDPAYRWLAKAGSGCVKIEEPHLDRSGQLLDEIQAARITTSEGEITLRPAAISALYLTAQEIEQSANRGFMAIDASQPHQELLAAWAGLPKNKKEKLIAAIDRDNDTPRLVLLPPDGRPVQLTLEFPGEQPQEALVRALKEWRSYSGLRNWAAFQVLLSVQGGRQGWVRWTLDEHMAAMGLSERAKKDPEKRAKIATEVELLTKIELAVYSNSGQERERRPLLLEGSRFERLAGSDWKLDGLELTMNPLLYGGVRNPTTNKLGKTWYPGSLELAHIDEHRFPYAYALGLILPMRWRMAANSGKGSITLSGENALSMAAISLNRRKPGEAWARLENNLQELQRRGSLGSWEWKSNPRTLAGMVELTAPAWARDVTLHGVRPVELPPAAQALTGAELKEWRERRGLTQAQVATMLGVTKLTILRAEANPEKPLTKRLRHGMSKAR